jgi:hypothetical protein
MKNIITLIIALWVSSAFPLIPGTRIASPSVPSAQISIEKTNQRKIVRYRAPTCDSVFVFYQETTPGVTPADTIKCVVLTVDSMGPAPLSVSSPVIIAEGRDPAVSINYLHRVHLAFIDKAGNLQYWKSEQGNISHWNSAGFVIPNAKCPVLDVTDRDSTAHIIWTVSDSLNYFNPVTNQTQYLALADSLDYQISACLYFSQSVAICLRSNHKIRQFAMIDDILGILPWGKDLVEISDSLPQLDSLEGSSPRFSLACESSSGSPGSSEYSTICNLIYQDKNSGSIRLRQSRYSSAYNCQNSNCHTWGGWSMGPGFDSVPGYGSRISHLAIDDLLIIPAFSFAFLAGDSLIHAYASFWGGPCIFKFDTVAINALSLSLGYRDYRETVVDLAWTAPETGANPDLYYMRVPKQTPLNGAVESAPLAAAKPGMLAVCPNPFKPATEISYMLSAPAHVTLDVFNAQGQRVARLADGMQRAGRFSRLFVTGNLPGGIYLCRLISGQTEISRKMVLVR